MIKKLRANHYYRLVLWAVFVLCLLMAAWYGSAAVIDSEWYYTDDFPEYWAAGRLNLQDGNPYDPWQLIPLQNQPGDRGDEAVMMWNPPWMLALVMPFAALAYPASRMLWMAFHMAALILSVDLLWQLYAGSPRLRWISWLLGFSWIPVLDLLKKGQSGILLLLGTAGFLFFVEKKRPWLAGACLALLAIKPHVAYLLLVAAFLWSLRQRAWAIIGGLAIALSAATFLVWAVNPQVISQYLYAIGNYPPTNWPTPTVGGVLRVFLGAERFWLQFMPSALGLIWLLIYWIRRRASWNWLEQAPLVILVSLVTMAYGWSFDQPIALVAIIQIFVLITILPLSVASISIGLGYALINLANLITPNIDFCLFWLAPATLAWYLLGTYLAHRNIPNYAGREGAR